MKKIRLTWYVWKIFSERIMLREAVRVPSSEGLKPPWVKALGHLAWIPSWHFFEQCIALGDLPAWIILWLILKNRKYNISKCLAESMYWSFNGSSTSFILHFFKGSYSYWVRIQDETVVGRKKCWTQATNENPEIHSILSSVYTLFSSLWEW